MTDETLSVVNVVVPVLFVKVTPGLTVVLVALTVPLKVTLPEEFSILMAEGLVPPALVTVVVPLTMTGALTSLMTRPASCRLAIEMLLNRTCVF